MSEQNQKLKILGKKISILEKERDLLTKRQQFVLDNLNRCHKDTRLYETTSKLAENIEIRLDEVETELTDLNEQWKDIYDESVEDINDSIISFHAKMEGRKREGDSDGDKPTVPTESVTTSTVTESTTTTSTSQTPNVVVTDISKTTKVTGLGDNRGKPPLPPISEDTGIDVGPTSSTLGPFATS